MFFNGFTLLLMIVAFGVGCWFYRLVAMETRYLAVALANKTSYDYDNEGQLVIYTGIYDQEPDLWRDN